MISDQEQVWLGPATVLQAKMACEPMSIIGQGLRDINFDSKGNSNQSSEGRTHRFISMASAQGCSHEIARDVDERFAMTGSWSSWSHYDGLSTIKQSEGLYAPLETFSRCPPADFIFFSDGLGSEQDLRISAQACSARYYVADLTARVTIGRGNSIVDVDEQDFVRNRVLLPTTAVNIQAFEKVFFAPWTMYFGPAGRTSSGSTDGPVDVLFAVSDSDVTFMINNSTWVEQAARFKQRFFGETVHEALLAQDQPGFEINEGTINTTRRRIVTVPSVAIALEVAVGSQIIVMMLLLAATRLRRRPLQLSSDPATFANRASLLTADQAVRSDLHGKEFWTLVKMQEWMGRHRYKLEGGRLRLDVSMTQLAANTGSTPSRNACVQPTQDCKAEPTWKEWPEPIAFRRWLLLELVTSLICIVSALVVLYFYASTGSLYQAAFVYRTPWDNGSAPEAISPASIVTTLLAISVGLWWGSMDSTLRRLQPFLAMTNGPRVGTRGPTLSYESSYPIWTTIRAAKRSHWLLAIVCLGTTISQICKCL